METDSTDGKAVFRQIGYLEGRYENMAAEVDVERVRTNLESVRAEIESVRTEVERVRGDLGREIERVRSSLNTMKWFIGSGFGILTITQVIEFFLQ